jgi:hypothetical protein
MQELEGLGVHEASLADGWVICPRSEKGSPLHRAFHGVCSRTSTDSRIRVVGWEMSLSDEVTGGDGIQLPANRIREMRGPRDYSSGTEKALFLLSQGTCYFPACDAPVIEFVEGTPIVNVHISHVCGAYPGSSRFDPDMSDDQRASFDNVVLLCKPHHDLIDRIRPEDFPRAVLLQWKIDREGSGLSALGELRGLSEVRFVEMIEQAVSTLGPVREVVLEMSGGVFLARGDAARMPLRGWGELLRHNQEALAGDRLLVATARNTGHLRATIESMALIIGVGLDSSDHDLSLVGRNDFPHLNPALPQPLEVGDSATWFTSLATVEMIVKACSVGSLRAVECWMEANLGTGEKVRSARHPTEELPF